MCGNHPSNKGGMTSVIEQIREYDWEKEGIELYFIPTFKPGNVFEKTLYFCIAYIKIFFFLLFQKPDLVHMHMSYKGSFTRKYMIHRLCVLFEIKDVIHLHGSEFKAWYDMSTAKKKNKIRRLLNEANFFIVLGEKWRKIILEIEPKTNIYVISNGIAIPQETVVWNENKLNLLFLGVLIPRKGVVDLLKAVLKIKDYILTNNIKLQIAGTGECEDELKKFTKEYDMSSFVHFCGWTSGEKKQKLLKSCQIMVMPSYNEGLPISLLEAISYGMPIIATDVGDISSVVKNNDNGILIEPGNIEELYNAILTVSKKDIFEKMSRKSREIAWNNSIELFYYKLLKIYNGEIIDE